MCLFQKKLFFYDLICLFCFARQLAQGDTQTRGQLFHSGCENTQLKNCRNAVKQTKHEREKVQSK